jgi:serine/threonine protein kinase
LDVIARLSSTLADRYEVEREIGTGGMATVYLARDLRHNRKGGPEGPAPGAVRRHRF